MKLNRRTESCGPGKLFARLLVIIVLGSLSKIRKELHQRNEMSRRCL
jgi:hypothetical protein